VWDGDVMVQEIQADKTVTYLYEPDSFVPLARIESNDGITAYAPDETHLWHVGGWGLPSAPGAVDAQVAAWRGHLQAQGELQHRERWAQRLVRAEAAAGGDHVLYYQCDHLGTPLELRDEQGEVAWAVRYRAWGRVFQHVAKRVEQPIRFQGQYEDRESGLFYNRFRYYDPDTTRFTTADPIGLLGGGNAYAYAPNPVTWTDALGLANGRAVNVFL
jgi:RHS repeat-associated protein